MNSYYQQWSTATMSNSNPQQGLRAPAIVSAAIVSEITIGCKTCSEINSTDPNLGVFNPSSGGAGRGF